jgi:hypothetical protein
MSIFDAQQGPDELDVSLEYLRDTEKAILVKDVDREFWLPKSQIKFERSDVNRSVVKVRMKEWLAKAKGLV